MIKLLTLICVCLQLCSFSIEGQNLPDSLVIRSNTYINNYNGGEAVDRTEKYLIIRQGSRYQLNGRTIARSKVSSLIYEIEKPTNKGNLLTIHGIDTTWVINNPTEVLKLYSGRGRVEWNEHQKELIFEKLTDVNVYRQQLLSYLNSGCCYTMHHNYRNDYQIEIFKEGKLANKIKSRRGVWGYLMPWSSIPQDSIYNYGIEESLKNIIKPNRRSKAPLKGEKLLEYLVNQIVDNNMKALYKLAAYTYEREIEELKTDFEIVSFEEVYGRGRYIWNEPKTMKIVLRNQFMLPNVRLNFLATKQGNTIYSRDSLKEDYRKIIEKVQSINFITSHLENHPGSVLDIYYFNNKGINEYNINSVNKDPVGWAKHDKYVESLKWYEKNNITPSFDVTQSIKTSRQNDAGCDFRFNRSFIEQAIFFEIREENKYSSIWFLLPDGKVLLYLMQGIKVLDYDYTDFGSQPGLQYPCALFDSSGQILEKK